MHLYLKFTFCIKIIYMNEWCVFCFFKLYFIYLNLKKYNKLFVNLFIL
jgi:hypothetical protein